MNDAIQGFLFFGAAISLLCYEAALLIKKKFKLAILNPLLVSVILLIAILSALHIDYQAYNESAKYISYLLTPTTVCLGVPLYRERALLKKHFGAIMVGTLTGVIVSMGTILILSVLFGLSHEEYVTFLPKSITTAIGMGISEEINGFVSITVASIVSTGIFGNVIAESLCKLLRIKNPIAQGIGIGAAAHAIGTSKAMEMGEIQGAMSSLAIVTSGLCTVILVSVFTAVY